MDESKIINKSLMQSITEEILLETKKNNDHTLLNSQLLTIIKDLVVKQSYIERKKNCTNPFNKYGRKCFSQTDEDGITHEIIKRLGINKGTYAEFGVGDGMENNTLLLASLGWKGFWVGGEDLVFDYPQNDRFNYTKEWITLENIIKVSKENMKKMNIENLDVISLDLDGNDFHFCESILRNNLNPKLFIIEYNSKFFPPIEFIMDYDQFHNWQLDDYYGASLQSFNNLFNNYEYKLICCNSHTGTNAFFVKNEFSTLFKEVPDSIDKIFMEPNFDLACKFGHFSSNRVISNIMNRVTF